MFVDLWSNFRTFDQSKIVRKYLHFFCLSFLHDGLERLCSKMGAGGADLSFFGLIMENLIKYLFLAV